MSPIRAGGCWPQSACRTAQNSPSMSPGTHRPYNPDQVHSSSRRPVGFPRLGQSGQNVIHPQQAARWADSLTATICVRGLGEAVIAAVPQQNRAADCAQIDVPFPDPGDVVPASATGAMPESLAHRFSERLGVRWASSSSRSREDSRSSKADTTPRPPETRDRSASDSIQRRTPMPQRPDRRRRQ